MVSTSPLFEPVSLTASQETRLEVMMKQQVQDAILARTTQLSAGSMNFDSEWRFVSSLGHLKTYKLRGLDSFNSTSSWATTLTNSTRTTACSVNDELNAGADMSAMSNRISAQRLCKRLSLSRRTTSVMTDRRDPPPLKSYRTFGRVQGHFRDIVNVLYTSNTADFIAQQKLLSPEAIDGAVLHTIRATQDSYLGIKWLAQNSFAGKRDVCFVEMVGYTTNTDGQEIGFVASASIDVPECPELTGSMKLTRVRMKRTLLIAPSVETKRTSELFIMGATETTESSIIEHAQYRMHMAVLNDISLAIDARNIAKHTLSPLENWIPDQTSPLCSICSRKFHFMYRRRHHCRLCGDVICKTCYVSRSVLGADTDQRANTYQTKFCVRCVIGLRAMDKRSEFSQQHSKLLSLKVEPSSVNMEPSSSTANMRGSFITYFKRGCNQKHHLNLNQLYTMSAAHEKSPEIDDNQTEDTRVLGGKYLLSSDSGSSRYYQSSLAVNPLHSYS